MPTVDLSVLGGRSGAGSKLAGQARLDAPARGGAGATFLVPAGRTPRISAAGNKSRTSGLWASGRCAKASQRSSRRQRFLSASKGVAAARGGHRRHHVIGALRAHLARGLLGVKPEPAFLHHEGPGPPPPAPDAGAVARQIEATLANEATSLVAEGVASDGIDPATKLGLNFPRGPVEAARAQGPDRIRAKLARLRGRVPSRITLPTDRGWCRTGSARPFPMPSPRCGHGWPGSPRTGSPWWAIPCPLMFRAGGPPGWAPFW